MFSYHAYLWHAGTSDGPLSSAESLLSQALLSPVGK